MNVSRATRFAAVAISDKSGSPLDTAPLHRLTDSDISDEHLIVEVCAGNTEALGVLFRRYARLVRSVAMRILSDSSEADDLLQDVFLFIHRKAGTFDNSKGSARSWIVQLTYHRAFDRRRYLHSRHFYTRLDLSQTTDEFARLSANFNESRFFGRVVGNATIGPLLDLLSEDQRSTLTLHFVEGFTFAEIAAKLDQSVGNVRNHYYRGLEKLRRQMFPGGLPSRNGNGKK